MKVHSEIPEGNLKELGELCQRTPPDGLIVEIGVYKGGSAYALSKVAGVRPLHLYDTFTGIPEQSLQDIIQIGQFADANLEAVKAALPDAYFHVGFFPDTLTDDVKNISFVHVDCDQYVTCKAAIELLWPRMNRGAIMAFDDYPFPGIKRAIHDAFGEYQLEFTFSRIPYVRKQ